MKYENIFSFLIAIIITTTPLAVSALTTEELLLQQQLQAAELQRQRIEFDNQQIIRANALQAQQNSFFGGGSGFGGGGGGGSATGIIGQVLSSIGQLTQSMVFQIAGQILGMLGGGAAGGGAQNSPFEEQVPFAPSTLQNSSGGFQTFNNSPFLGSSGQNVFSTSAPITASGLQTSPVFIRAGSTFEFRNPTNQVLVAQLRDSSGASQTIVIPAKVGNTDGSLRRVFSTPGLFQLLGTGSAAPILGTINVQ